jgi:uncharacterized protein YlxW (UPF0749 family)
VSVTDDVVAEPAEAVEPADPAEAVEPADPAEPVEPADPADEARRRLLRALRPRPTRGQLLAALLCAVLGFGLAVQARQIHSQGLQSLRQADLVSLLNTVTDRSNRLEAETRTLQDLRDQLRSGTDRSAAAQAAARQRLDVLGVLAGTAAATGPGIRLSIRDPSDAVTAAILLDTLQELRDAGAEAVQVGSVRVVASTAFVDDPGGRGVRVDDSLVNPPYEFLAIGDSATLAAALGIPGGVLEVLRQKGATGTVTQVDSLTVGALRRAPTAQYARPAPAAPP